MGAKEQIIENTDSYLISLDEKQRVIVNQKLFATPQEAYAFYSKQIKMRQAGDDTVRKIMEALERLIDR